MFYLWSLLLLAHNTAHLAFTHDIKAQWQQRLSIMDAPTKHISLAFHSFKEISSVQPGV